MKISRLFLFLPLLVALGACTKDTPELKSPCTGIDNSPCGEKRPVNEWWMRQA